MPTIIAIRFQVPKWELVSYVGVWRALIWFTFIATFELQIPQAHYDGIALLEVIDQHSKDTALNLSGDTYPMPVRQFQWALTSRQLFEWLKMTRGETLADIQRAARFYYLQQHAFDGKVQGQTFGTATTSPAINLCRIEESLSAAHMRLAGTTVENLPWEACIDRYDRPHTFFYMDPPYWETEGYGVPFDFEQYQRMATRLRSMKGRARVSINDHPEIRAVFAGLPLMELEIQYCVRGQGERKTSRELAITNYDPVSIGGLFDANV